MINRIPQKSTAMFVETGDGEGIRKAKGLVGMKDTVVGLLITSPDKDIAHLSKEFPNIQVRYCLTKNMFQCRTMHDPIPACVE